MTVFIICTKVILNIRSHRAMRRNTKKKSISTYGHPAVSGATRFTMGHG